MTLLALIPARGGSKGIPRKNIRSFCGKPLIQWSIDAALSASSVDQVVVSTDDLEIAEVSKRCGASVPFLRPADIASDSAPGIAPVLHALEVIPDVDHLLLLQPTSPLRTSDDIDAIVELLQQTKRESAVSLALSSKHPSWMYTKLNDHRLIPVLGNEKPDCRQQLTPAYVLNGALYLAAKSFLIREKSLVTKDTVGYVMPPERSVDIDTWYDFSFAEFLFAHQIK